MEPSNQSIVPPKASWFDRNGFPAWVVVLSWFLGSLVLFQIGGSVLSLAFIVIRIGHMPDFSTMNDVLKKNLDLVFLGNSIGQFLFLGIGSWFMSKLAAPGGKVGSFTGFKAPKNIGFLLILALLIFIVIQPVVWFLGWVNSLIPFPSFYLNFEKAQDSILKDFLSGNMSVWYVLINVALVPAIFEEFMYRGFFLNIIKKSGGPALAIILSGFMFGAYHIRFTQIIPLSFLGMLLGYLAWRAESIYPAMIGHFVNNGLSVILAAFAPSFVFSKNTTDNMPPLLWIVLSVLVTGYLIYLFVTESQNNVKGVSDV